MSEELSENEKKMVTEMLGKMLGKELANMMEKIKEKDRTGEARFKLIIEKLDRLIDLVKNNA